MSKDKYYFAFANISALLVTVFIASIFIGIERNELAIISAIGYLLLYYFCVHASITLKETGLRIKVAGRTEWIDYEEIMDIVEKKWRGKNDRSTFLQYAHVIYTRDNRVMAIDHRFFTRMTAFKITNEILIRRNSRLDNARVEI